MKKALSIALICLLMSHILAHGLVCVGAWWQAEHDLSERLQVYRSVDSLIEFTIPLLDGNTTSLIKLTNDGFTYRDHYYEVVSLELREGTVHIAGLEMPNHSLWQGDLLSFLTDHLSSATNAQQKGSQFLKFLLKEYPPNSRTVFCFLSPHRHEISRLPDLSVVIPARTRPVPSPPPQA